ncbi:Cysteine protease family C01A [Phytophthora palmivora]|uniref:Cysteine protease family C01A n=1 Tax=Phytophthora palmivora TaxID=4796 RepID=A0A2P4Y4V1_9STRA|nr:Cysteine protease family C01A [Phytophthora palmivora]
MRHSTLCFVMVAAVTVVATPVVARPMHAGIDYQRYLKEIDTTQADLDEWKSKYGDIAQKNGWMPVSEDRNADDQEEDLRQRIFLTKQNIASVQAANPDANFSIMSPFSAMTNDEFNTYVLNSYVRGNSTQSGSGTATRQLRSAGSSNSSIDENNSDSTSFIKAIESIFQTLINGLNSGTVQPATDNSVNVLTESSGSQASYKFSDFWDWRPQNPTRAPITDAPTTTQPTTTTSSAMAETESSSVDWSTTKCMAPVQSQGSCGSCWAFATVSAVESAQCIANGKTSLTKYSEQQLVSCNTQNWGCNGGAPVYALDSSCNSQDVGITGYSQLSDEDELLSAIDEHPVIVAVASGNNVWKQYSGGVVSSCDSWNLDHAVVAVGYDSSSIKIRNSWGTYWGEDGYIRLARSSSREGTCGVTSDMSTLQM